MSLHKHLLPSPKAYYTRQGLAFKERRGKWRTTRCEFHGGSDSMRVNLKTGAFVCMAGCGARGGDVIAYHMAAHGLDFVRAAKDLGAWTSGRPARPAPFTAQQGLEVLADEALLIAILASDMAQGQPLAPPDLQRLMQAVGRIRYVAEVCHG